MNPDHGVCFEPVIIYMTLAGGEKLNEEELKYIKTKNFQWFVEGGSVRRRLPCSPSPVS